MDQPDCGLRCNRVTDQGICDRCARLTLADLEAMSELYDQVREKLLEAQASTMGDRVSGTRERPLGFSVDALSLIGPINNPGLPMLAQFRDQTGPPPMLDTLSGWARVVIDERNLNSAPKMTTESLAGLLLIHHDWAVTQPWADEYAFDIRGCAHEARRLCGLYDARPEPIAGVECRRCSGLSLVRVPGSRYAAECKGEITNDRGDTDMCGALLTPDEYHDWVAMCAAYAKQKGKIA